MSSKNPLKVVHTEQVFSRAGIQYKSPQRGGIPENKKAPKEGAGARFYLLACTV